MKDQINWGILGTGAIARTFARALGEARTGRLTAVASRSQPTADAFAREFKIERAYPNYEAVLEDRQVDAVYIAPPHPMHAEWTIRACDARKHVLVEKPIGVNQLEAEKMIDAARKNGVFLMEAFMYRCHPQTAALIELIRNSAIGQVRVIQATFSFHADFDAQSRLFSNAMAGGGILDVGCYPVSMSRLIAGAATGKDFADPIEVKAVGHLGKTGVDEWAIGSLKFPGNILAQVATGVSVEQENVVRVFGSDGRITLPNPWVANRTGPDQGLILIQGRSEPAPRQFQVKANRTSFTYEADVVGGAILAGQKQASAPAMSWDDSMGNIRTLDQWRQSIGLTYDFEKKGG